MNSRRKGVEGELEWAKYLRDHWNVDGARRGQQFAGSTDSPDVIGIDGVHFEVKRTEALRLNEAMTQAINDAGTNVPVVAHRRNRGEWQITLRASDVPAFVRAFAGIEGRPVYPERTEE